MRVIAGSARGRPLVAPKSETRPTSDKVKGAIFSMLEAEAMRRGHAPQEHDGAWLFAAAHAWPRWLDLFAGSGALGIEALSRGATAVDFVEREPLARAALLANLQRAGVKDRANLLRGSSETLFAAPDRRYDVVLLDPPYAAVGPEQVLARVEQAGLANPGGIVVLEHARQSPAPARVGVLHLLRTRSHGRTSISLYEPETTTGA